jgi:hypothetical protein
MIHTIRFWILIDVIILCLCYISFDAVYVTIINNKVNHIKVEKYGFGQ